MARFEVSGYIIRGFSFGESSRVITLFTLEKGKLKCIAKGAKKSATTKGGAIDLFSRVKCNIYLKEEAELGTIGSVDLLDNYSTLALDPTKFGFGSAFCEIIDKSTTIEQPLPELYELTGEFFDLVIKCDQSAAASLFWASLLKVLIILGYQPRLFECVVCGRKNEGKAAFYDPQKGGLVCSKDVIEHIQYGKLSKAGLIALQGFVSQSLAKIAQNDYPRKILGEIEQFILSFADYHTGLRRNLKSFKFLSQLK
jgi:DNA repair protein RecO (recombination protein O)